MYTIYPQRGIVTRDLDGYVVSPVSDTTDPAHVEWLAWCAAGNSPTLGVEAAPAERILTKLAFRRRFTLAERVAMDSAPDNTAFDANTRAILRTMTRDLELAEDINLDDADVISGVMLLEQLQIIAAGRAAEVLA